MYKYVQVKVAYPVSQAASEAPPLRPTPKSARSALLLSPTSSCPMIGGTLTDERATSRAENRISTPIRSLRKGRPRSASKRGRRVAVFDQLINIGQRKFTFPSHVPFTDNFDDGRKLLQEIRRSREGGGKSTQGRREEKGVLRFVTVNLW